MASCSWLDLPSRSHSELSVWFMEDLGRGCYYHSERLRLAQGGFLAHPNDSR